MKFTSTFLSSLLLMLTLFPQPGMHAASQDEQTRNNLFPPSSDRSSRTTNASEAESNVSQRRAYDLARERFPGNVLNIRMENRRWNVRMEQEGTVFEVHVDAESGSVTRASEKE